MRKLIVGNFVTLDGCYDGKDKNLSAIFDYQHPDYAGDDHFDFYNAERLRAADTLLLNGRKSFLDNQTYWTSVLANPDATLIRREFAQAAPLKLRSHPLACAAHAGRHSWRHARVGERHARQLYSGQLYCCKMRAKSGQMGQIAGQFRRM